MSYRTLLSYALSLLSKRSHSIFEIKQKLAKKDGVENDIDRVVARLEELNYLNDERFVDDWIRSRARSKPRGIMMLKQELSKKGIERDLINSRVTGKTVDELESASKLLEKKSAKLMRVSEKDKKDKICAILRSKGFSGETIYRLMDSW